MAQTRMPIAIRRALDALIAVSRSRGYSDDFVVQLLQEMTEVLNESQPVPPAKESVSSERPKTPTWTG